MRRLRSLLVALTVALVAVPLLNAGPASADGTPSSGGDVVTACKANVGANVPQAGPRGCRTAQSYVWGTGATCRAVAKEQGTSGAEQCEPIDGRTISEHQVQLYESSWVHKALALQRSLDEAAPLWDEQLPHTHNTFNSSAYTLPHDGRVPSYYPTLTNQDPNQAYSITDQLRMDVRAIEIDVHWVPSPFAAQHLQDHPDTGGYWVTMCHGDGEQPAPPAPAVHVGCTDDRPFEDGIAEFRAWLDANPNDFVLLYLENQLFGDPTAHAIAASIVDTGLGDLVYRPPAGGGCTTMPYGTSAATIKAANNGHARVLIVGNCGPGGSPWNSLVFSRGNAWIEGGDPSAYFDDPDPTHDSPCRQDQGARLARSSFRRVYEDSTFVSAMVSGEDNAPFSPEKTALMVRCGVNIIGMDQLTPQDPRLTALVWSWAAGQPAANGGPCAYEGGDARFRNGNCERQRTFACVDAARTWHVTAAKGEWEQGFRACQQSGWTFAVPVNGFQGDQLAKARPSGAEVWLDYRQTSAGWTPNLTRPPAGHGGGDGHRGGDGRPAGGSAGHATAAPGQRTGHSGGGGGPAAIERASSTHELPTGGVAIILASIGAVAAWCGGRSRRPRRARPVDRRCRP